jgi:leucyl aminopeptidase
MAIDFRFTICPPSAAGILSEKGGKRAIMARSPEEVLVAAGAAKEAGRIRTLLLVRPETLSSTLEKLTASQRAWAKAHDFAGRPGEVLLLPEDGGEPETALAGLGAKEGPALAELALARCLPEGLWEVRNAELLADAHVATLGWVLSAYAFEAYRAAEREPARLVCPKGVDRQAVLAEAGGVWFARNLVNTPASDLGPAELAAHAAEMAAQFGAEIRITEGASLRRGFPMVHAVGAGAAPERAPRVAEIFWGDRNAPRLAVVGKGVCFDTGGLDIKPSSAMRLMKKDMGGAAAALALARMIMALSLPVRLHVVVPMVENAVSAGAMRPGDVFRTRAGLTVEIGNTDAEGRLILADALARACEERPEILLDFATLTGAARVALGPELPALFTPDDDLADALLQAGKDADDPLWRLPLWAPYAEGLKSPVADLCNIAANGQAGAIHAALFLQRFVSGVRSWAHFDIFAWNPAERPARPKGGELHAARAALLMLKRHLKTRP